MTDEQHLRVIKAEISARLRPVCSDWPADLFDEMVEELARITQKYDRKTGANVYDRRATERLIADLTEVLDRAARHRNPD